MDLFEQLKANKFPYTDNLIHLFRGGSDLHGAQLVNKHDDDWYGVYVEPPEMVIGLKDYPHYVWSSAGDTKRNVPGDMDICFYSLRKWRSSPRVGIQLACHTSLPTIRYLPLIYGKRYGTCGPSS